MDAKEIKEYREKYNLTQKELCCIVKSSLRAVQYWEQGRRKIPASAVELMNIYEKMNNNIILGNTQDKQEKLRLIFNFLKNQGKIRNQQEFADIIDFNRSSISSALNVNKSYLNKNLFYKIIAKFPEVLPILSTPSSTTIIQHGNDNLTNTGKISRDFIFNPELSSTRDFEKLYKSYNINKETEIDRLQVLYDNIISEKNALIQELKGVIKDLREDKRQLTSIIEKQNQ